VIYLDNAATSFPKPKETGEHLNRFITNIGGNPGRSGHSLSVEAARIIFDAREKLTGFIHGSDSERLIFTSMALILSISQYSDSSTGEIISLPHPWSTTLSCAPLCFL
jgi:selenocysteine lyase/cysteine desulfurase